METNPTVFVIKGLALFDSGQICITQGAILAIPSEEIADALCRHAAGDWGCLDPEDFAANNRALEEDGMLFSAYMSKSGTRFWIITEADRSATTVLLPEEY